MYVRCSTRVWLCHAGARVPDLCCTHAVCTCCRYYPCSDLYNSSKDSYVCTVNVFLGVTSKCGTVSLKLSSFQKCYSIMASTQVPLIDGDNPCYCPNISSSAYLTMLRQALQASSNPFHHFTMHSPFWRLGVGVFKDGVQKPDETAQDMASSSPFPSSPLVSRNIPPSIRMSDFERNQIPDDLAGAPVLSRGRPVGPAWHHMNLVTLKRPISTASYLARAHTVVKRRRYSSAVPSGSSGDQDHRKRLSFGKNDELETFFIDRRLVEPLAPGTRFHYLDLAHKPFRTFCFAVSPFSMCSDIRPQPAVNRHCSLLKLFSHSWMSSSQDSASDRH